MRIVLKELLARSSLCKWLIAVVFLSSLPALLPLLFLVSFLVLMLLFPLGCALVGFLSWQRLRAGPHAAAREEKQGNLFLNCLLVNSGFVKSVLSLLLISQLARLVEWEEKTEDSGSDEGSRMGGDSGDKTSDSLPTRGEDGLLHPDDDNDVLFWYNPLASIFNADNQVFADSDEESLQTDADSGVSDVNIEVFCSQVCSQARENLQLFDSHDYEANSGRLSFNSSEIMQDYEKLEKKVLSDHEKVDPALQLEFDDEIFYTGHHELKRYADCTAGVGVTASVVESEASDVSCRHRVGRKGNMSTSVSSISAASGLSVSASSSISSSPITWSSWSDESRNYGDARLRNTRNIYGVHGRTMGGRRAGGSSQGATHGQTIGRAGRRADASSKGGVHSHTVGIKRVDATAAEDDSECSDARHYYCRIKKNTTSAAGTAKQRRSGGAGSTREGSGGGAVEDGEGRGRTCTELPSGGGGGDEDRRPLFNEWQRAVRRRLAPASPPIPLSAASSSELQEAWRRVAHGESGGHHQHHPMNDPSSDDVHGRGTLQLLEFWRSMEQAYLQATTKPSSDH